MSKKRQNKRKSQLASAQGATAGETSSTSESIEYASMLLASGAALVGMLLVWAVLTPADSVSVYTGETLPQNLCWLLAGLLGAGAVSLGSGANPAASWRVQVAGYAAVIWLIIVTWLAGLHDNPRIAWNGFWQVVSLVVCYLTVARLAVGNRSRAAIVSIVVCGSLALAVHGLHQVNVSMPRDRETYLADPDSMLQAIGIAAPEGSAERRRFEDRLLRSNEPYATFALANSLGTNLSAGMVIVFAIGLLFVQDPSLSISRHARWRAFAVGVGGAAIASTLLLTRSKAAYAAFAAAMLYWFIVSRSSSGRGLSKLQFRVGGFVFIGLAGSGALWLFWQDRLVFSEAYYSLSFRFEYWAATLKMLSEHWLTGIGLGNFQAYYPAYKLELASETVADPHNWILDIAATMSVPIAILVVVWVAKKLLMPMLEDGVSGNSDLREEEVAEGERIDRLISKCLIGGAAVGGAVCMMLLRMLVGIDEQALVGSWLIAVVVCWVLWPYIFHLVATKSIAVPAAVFSVFVGLLATGSWQSSGIAVPTLALLVVANSNVKTEAATKTQRLMQWTVPAAALILFIVQSWMPVTNCWSFEQQMALATSADRQISFVEKAADADPLDTRPLQWKADLAVRRAMGSPADQFDRMAHQAATEVEKWLQRDSTRFLNWFRAGEQMLQLASVARRIGQPEESWLKKSVDYFETAANRHPTSAKLQIQVAIASKIYGDNAKSSTFLAEAERLSAATPHYDKTLEMQTISLPAMLVDNELSALLPLGNAEAFGAELALPWLRNREDD